MYPRLDEYASARAGEPLELLSRIPAQQPYEPRGIVLSADALDLLMRSHGRRIQGGSVRNSDAGRELRDQGLLGRFGGLVGEGAEMGQILAEQTSRVLMASTRGGRRVTWTSWSTSARSVVRAGDPHGASEEQRIETAPRASVIGRAVSWAGIAPAWPLADSADPVVVDDAVIEARLLDATVPAPSDTADLPVFQRAWTQPWRRLEGGGGPADVGFRVLHLGDTGYWNLAPAEEPGRSALRPMGSASLFRILAEMFAPRA